MIGFASGVPARVQPRRIRPDLPYGPCGPPRSPVAPIPAGFFSCSSAAGSELEPPGCISSEGSRSPAASSERAHWSSPRPFSLLCGMRTLLPYKRRGLRRFRLRLTARGIPCGGRRVCAPRFEGVLDRLRGLGGGSVRGSPCNGPARLRLTSLRPPPSACSAHGAPCCESLCDRPPLCASWHREGMRLMGSARLPPWIFLIHRRDA